MLTTAEKTARGTEYLLIFLFFGWLIGCIFFGERIPTSDGLGYDGITYAKIALQLPSLIHHLPIYTTQRILPSSVIYFFSQLTHSNLTNADMPMVFSIYNTTILLIAVLTWRAIANHFKWSPQVRLISFAGLFLNFAILKMNTYYPILTDTTAFVLGVLMVYFFIANKNHWLLLTSMLGAFTFPTLFYIGLILFIFSGLEKQNLNSYIRPSKGHTFFSLLHTIAITATAFFFFYTISSTGEQPLGRIDAMPILTLSLLALFFYVFFSASPLYRCYLTTLSRIRSGMTFRLFPAVFSIIFINSLIHFFSTNDPGALTLSLFSRAVMVQSLAYPFNFLISHVLYYGPIVCLLVLYWKEAVNWIENQKLGLLFITALYVTLSIGSESRQFINFLPFVVITTAEVLSKKNISWNFTYTFVLLSLAISRVWLPLNHGAWPSLDTNSPLITLEFPMQWYFMNQGPWVSHTMYFINLLIVSTLFLFLYKKIKHISTDTTKP